MSQETEVTTRPNEDETEGMLNRKPRARMLRKAYPLQLLLLQRIDLEKLEGIPRLLRILMHKKNKVETLGCIRCSFSDAGTEVLSRALCNKLEDHDLMISRHKKSYARFDREQVDPTADSKLKNLMIQQAGILTEGGRHLANALKANTTLETLDLGGNYIGPAGGTAFAETLRVNTALRRLILHGNGIEGKGTDTLRAMMGRRLKDNCPDLRVVAGTTTKPLVLRPSIGSNSLSSTAPTFSISANVIQAVMPSFPRLGSQDTTNMDDLQYFEPDDSRRTVETMMSWQQSRYGFRHPLDGGTSLCPLK